MGSEARIIIFSVNSDVVEKFNSVLSSIYSTELVPSPVELENIFKTNHPDLVIIDSNFELCVKLKSIKDVDSIVILTMPSDNDFDINEILKSKADSYIEYPFPKNELLSNINFLLDERKQKKHFSQILNVTKESEQKYKRLFQLSPDGVGYHVGGKIGFINDAGIKILGAKSFEEIFGKYLLDFVHPFDKDFVFEKTKNRPKDRPLYIEARIVTLDSQTKYVDIVSTPFLLGGVNAVQFILRDITEKKLNELNLIESKLRLEFVQTIAKLGYWEFDTRNNKLIWSKDIYKMFGLSEKDFQPNLKNFLNLIYPDDRKVFHQALDASLSGITFLNIEHRIIKTDGQIIYVNQRGAVSYDEKGNIVKFSGSVQDITDRKLMENALRESQSKLSGIINSAMDAVITVDDKQNIILFNSTAEKMFRCSADEVLDKPLDRFIPERFRNIHQKYVEKFGKTGVSMRTMGAINPISGLRADGEEFPIEASVSQVEVSGQKLFTVIIRDVTGKKKADDELKNSREQLRELTAHLQNVQEEERSAIAREIHDELGQVLTSLKMNLTFIDKKLTGDEVRINPDDLHSEITGMKSVIDKSVKRLRKIITELRPEVLDQLGLISALEWQTNEFKTKSGIDCKLLNYIGDSEVNKNISIAVYRIFQEALTNVMRHSKATKVEIKIAKTNNHLELEIFDNGVGFEQEKNKSKTFCVLGMRERAIILGGDFKIENIKPSGTKVSVHIPLEII